MARNRTMADGRKTPVFYIDVELDDAGLTASQYRVYARIVRRAGEDVCFESIENIASGCRLEKKTVLQCLRDLLQANLIKKIKRVGLTSHYTLVDKAEWRLEGLNRRERKRAIPIQHPTHSAPQGLYQSAPLPPHPFSTPLRSTHEEIPSKTGAAAPQSVGTIAPTHAPCPRCKLPVRILSSGGVPCAWCLTCEVDALVEAAPEIESEAARAFGFFKHEFKRRRGEFPHLTKGKDFGIIKGLVRDYGRLRVESLMRGYFDLTDDYVRNAGYSVAFFSTRINALLIATTGEIRDCTACGKDGLPNGFVRTERGAAPCAACNFGALNGKANRQIEASAV